MPNEVAQECASCKVVVLSSNHEEPLPRLKNIIARSKKRYLVLSMASPDSIPTHMEGKYNSIQ